MGREHQYRIERTKMGTEQKEDGDSLAERRVRYVEKRKELGKKPINAEVGGVQTRDRERGVEARHRFIH